ncbi:MAG TPA: hypothetical protein VMH41_03925, partial [Mycobacteriales bacterium]|nr:hypothetical protein [Mycobacteriales bacterium]
MTAWNRLGREASMASFGKLVAAAIAVMLMANLGHGPTHDHRHAIYIWLVIGVLPVLMQLGVPWMKVHAPQVEVPYLLSMGFVDMVVVIAVVSLTGGIEGPFWVLMLVTTSGAAVIAPGKTIAVVQALGMVGALVFATALAHTLTKANSGPLVLVGLCTPLVALLGSAVSSSLEAQRVASATERDRLKSTVDELSAALAQAAQGDLSVHVEADADAQS